MSQFICVRIVGPHVFTADRISLKTKLRGQAYFQAYVNKRIFNCAHSTHLYDFLKVDKSRRHLDLQATAVYFSKLIADYIKVSSHRNCLKMSQRDSTPGLDLWQINVLCDVGNTSTFILTVTKDCYTAELFEKLREHPKAPQTDDFQLYSISGTIRSCFVESLEERLSKYGITDRSTLGLVAILTGGVWPTLNEVEAEPRRLSPADGITLTTISKEHPDVLGLECDGPGVIMRCGHATAPMPLALYCLIELEKGKDAIRCPECNDKWKFAILKPAACLSPNEITEFEQRAHINYFRIHRGKMNSCPKCGTFSRPRRAEDKSVVCQNCTSHFGKRFEFCWTCLGEWKTFENETCGNSNCGSNKELYELLASCETKELNGIEVPSKRACPNCSFIIHHDDGCKHVTCAYCSYEFCFICLRKYPCETDVFEPCDVAPRQTSDTHFLNDEEESGESDDDLYAGGVFYNLTRAFMEVPAPSEEWLAKVIAIHERLAIALAELSSRIADVQALLSCNRPKRRKQKKIFPPQRLKSVDQHHTIVNAGGIEMN